MKIQINLLKVKQLKVTVDEYVFILAVATNQVDKILPVLKLNDANLVNIQHLGVIKIEDIAKTKYLITQEHVKKAQKLLSVDEISWIEEYLNLFPEGVKSMGYYVRGSKSAALANMKAFMNEHDYSKEVILGATKDYVDKMKHVGYRGMQLSHYFISKNKNSTLESYCRAYTKTQDHESRILTDEFSVDV